MKEVASFEQQSFVHSLAKSENHYGRDVNHSCSGQRITIETDDGMKYIFVMHSWDECPHFVRREKTDDFVIETSYKGHSLPVKVDEKMRDVFGKYICKDGKPNPDTQDIAGGVIFSTMYEDKW